MKSICEILALVTAFCMFSVIVSLYCLSWAGMGVFFALACLSGSTLLGLEIYTAERIEGRTKQANHGGR